MHLKGIWVYALMSIIMALALNSCGGGASTPDLNPGQGVGNLPGQQRPDTGAVSGPDWLKVPAGDVDPVFAPLGTNPDYDMQLIGGSTVATEDPRSSSLVVVPPIGDFNPLGITMMKDGVAPDFSLTSNTFSEGEKVDLYMKYEVPAGDFKLDRRWISPLINLDVTEPNVNHTSANIYVVKLDWNIPMGTAGQNGVFSYTLKHEAVTKASPNFNFNISGVIPTVTQRYPTTGDAQIAWEDLLVNSDYDYNDFVTRVSFKEYRRTGDNALLQVDFTAKALARGAGYSAAWQFNMSNAFPGATVKAVVKQYKKNGQLRNQASWQSSNGTDIPIFTPTHDALPAPEGTWATNTVANTKYVEGDYVKVSIYFDQPFTGQSLAMPYNPLLKVTANNGQVYSIGIWKQKGDNLDTQGNPLVDSNGRPLAFIVPNTYAWPLETEGAWKAYAGYNTWVDWIKSVVNLPLLSKWYELPPTNPSMAYSRAKFTGTGKDYDQQDAGN